MISRVVALDQAGADTGCVTHHTETESSDCCDLPQQGGACHSERGYDHLNKLIKISWIQCKVSRESIFHHCLPDQVILVVELIKSLGTGKYVKMFRHCGPRYLTDCSPWSSWDS